eukprot:Transcript_27425.p1 GENE.Transcript_27425~~Transcript_27425.p1  ORF type:complete len:294 (+),score=87.43 Transcript_27425:118-999(+)
MGQQAQQLAAGGIGGACLAAVGAPFDCVKVRQQASGSSTPAVVASILRSEGVRGLWRGVGPPLLTAPPTFAIVAWSYDNNRRLIQQHLAPLSPLQTTALAGACVAPFTALIYTPVERVKCLLQCDGERVAAGLAPRYVGMRSCAATVLREGGLRSLFQGLSMTLARDVPAWATYFAVYHEAKRAFAGGGAAVLDGSAPLTPVATFAAGALAGASTWAVCIPQDTIKTRWQSGRYRSHAHVVRSLLRGPGGGLARLFHGFWPIVLGGVPRDGACLLGIEAANRVFTLWSRRPDR